MSRLSNKLPFVLLFAILVVSCEEFEQFINDLDINYFVNLQPIGVGIEPKKNDILPESFTPVIIKFDTKMKKRNAESILQINSDLGGVSGEKYWKENNLYFVPVSGWTAGIRYNLSFSGIIQTVDGREARIENYISFYAINKDAPPFLESYSPADGESVKTNDIIFEFNFSQSMNKLSVESALSIEGIGNKTFEWSDDDKKLLVASDKAFSPWNYYKWYLKDSAKCIKGIPIAKSYSGGFITDIDQTLPRITNVYPVLFSNDGWYPAAVNMEKGLESGHGIAVSFNKPMNENILRSLRFEPSLSGRTELLTENSIVYIFSRDPEPETAYTLIVSGDTKDAEGLKIGEDYKTNFLVNIPYINILSLSVNYGDLIENFQNINNIIPVVPDQATKELNISINFSLPFINTKEKQSIEQKINISPFFPRTISSVSLLFINWTVNNRLFMRWKGFSAGDSSGENGEVPHYYKLIIPGGKNGISCGNGIYMKEDFIIFLEAVK